MPRGKQYTMDEKAKIQAWLAGNVTYLEMARRLQRDFSGVRKMATTLLKLLLDAPPCRPRPVLATPG